MGPATRFRKLGQRRAKDKPRLPEQGTVALMGYTPKSSSTLLCFEVVSEARIEDDDHFAHEGGKSDFLSFAAL
jgi:hypothetical protein